MSERGLNSRLQPAMYVISLAGLGLPSASAKVFTGA